VDDRSAVACVIYAAKSTEDRHGSIPEQLDECRTVIAGDSGRRLVAEYRDEAFSAYRRNRGPGLISAMQHAEDLAAESGSAELWAQHSDRLARGDGRSARHAVEIALWALKRDIAVRTIQDPDTFRDLLYAVVTGQRNHEDSRRKGLAIAAGQRRAAARGHYIGHVVDGYRVAVAINERGVVTKRLTFDPERRPLFEMIFRMALRGESLTVIATAANQAGWPTARPALGMGTTWSRRRIHYILTNPRYAGLSVVVGEVVARGDWPAYITEHEHEGVRARLSRSKPLTKRRKFEKFLLAGLLICRECGATMHCVTGDERIDGTRGRRYECATRAKALQPSCSGRNMDATMLEIMLISNLRMYLLERPPEELQHGEDRPQTEACVSTTSVERERLLDAVLAQDDQGIDRALTTLFARTESVGLQRQVALSGRHARQLEVVGRFETWAEQQVFGDSKASHEQVPTLNRQLHVWFSKVSVVMDDTKVILATERRGESADAPAWGRVEARFDRKAWSRAAALRQMPHPRHAWWADAEIIGALQAWAQAHGRSPSYSEWRQGDSYRPTAYTVAVRFKQWTSALRIAGLNPRAEARYGRKRAWRDADIIDALTEWTASHDRAPLSEEWRFAAPEHPTWETVRSHFGGWRAGLEAAGVAGRRRRGTKTS
jgi:DNA invertase Pin-like site-specific DNA recombinase